MRRRGTVGGPDIQIGQKDGKWKARSVPPPGWTQKVPEIGTKWAKYIHHLICFIIIIISTIRVGDGCWGGGLSGI